MQRAIDIALNGAGKVSPNPLVGCVIVHNDRIIGEGWHKEFGGPHAEINALNSIHDKELLASATMYVTLEPCSHYGKTPPCAKAIIESGIRHVVFGITDPNPLVAGKGAAMLREAGIKVEHPVLEKENTELNKRFITFIRHKTPFVILKWAQTADGFIAPDLTSLKQDEFERQRHISGHITQQLTHKWRSEEDAVMVGTNTVITDNPQLNVRAWHGRSPVRIVLDLNNRLSKEARVFDDQHRTLVFNDEAHLQQSYGQTSFVPVNRGGNLIKQVLHNCYERNIQSVIVEGGAHLLQTFIAEKAWHEAQVITAQKRFGAGVQAPQPGGRIFRSFTLDQNQISIIKPE